MMLIPSRVEMKTAGKECIIVQIQDVGRSPIARAKRQVAGGGRGLSIAF